MGFWNLRRVQEETRRLGPYVFFGPVKIREVYCDEQNRPFDYGDARLRDIVRLWRDWFRTPVLSWPEDFVGRVKSAARWKKL